MQKHLLVAIVGIGLIAAGAYVRLAKPVTAAAQSQQSSAVFDSQGRMQVPDPHVFRRWVFVGAPLTPNGLNGGTAACGTAKSPCKTPFPEYHHVYIEQKNVDGYLKTGTFPEGTVIVKELTLVLNPTFQDGSEKEPSGRGFFNGRYNGIDASVRDSKRFAKTNGWGYFTFGHHALPYEKTAAEQPVSECAGCHIANVAKTDMTYIQFYPILRDKDPAK